MNHLDQLRQVIEATLWLGGDLDTEGVAGMNADAVLAATYPPACQTCLGWAQVIDGEHGLEPAPYIDHRRPPQVRSCPDCPTIAQLLAWGVAVAANEFTGADPKGDDLEGGAVHAFYAGHDACWRAIRQVKP